MRTVDGGITCRRRAERAGAIAGAPEREFLRLLCHPTPNAVTSTRRLTTRRRSSSSSRGDSGSSPCRACARRPVTSPMPSTSPRRRHADDACSSRAMGPPSAVARGPPPPTRRDPQDHVLVTDGANLYALSASEAARLIHDGVISSEQVVESCLERIRDVDDDVQAWAFLDAEYARFQARAADERRLTGGQIGPLHGVPVGLKDIIDTADMPTENGSVLHAGRTPSRDAAVVALLRGAGAVIMGKTVTTEFATRTPGKTRNPHNPAHTPGGSSSGSAAAVAAGMVPLALGSQTAGSTIRPASFCGVYGFKPTHGLIPCHGMFRLSRTLDHVGLFARTIEDLALLAGQLVGYDERDPDSRPRARMPFAE